jgi:hypothetical protein
MAENASVVRYLASTIANTAGTILGLADGGAVTYTGAMRCFVGVLETAQVRARGDGTSPTTTEGEVINPGETVYLTESELQLTKFIRTGSTSATLKGHIYNVPLPVLLGRD